MVARRGFDAGAQGDVSVRVGCRIEQPGVAEQSEIAKARCRHRVKINAVMFPGAGVLRMEDGQGQTQAEPLRDGIRRRDIERMDVRDRRVPQRRLIIGTVENPVRMQVAIRNPRVPLLTFEIGDALRAQTERHVFGRHSALAQNSGSESHRDKRDGENDEPVMVWPRD